MKFVKKSIPSEFVQFDPSHVPEGVKIRQAGPLGRWEVWNDLHGSWIGFHNGDWLNVSTPTDIYPVEDKIFRTTYVKYEP